MCSIFPFCADQLLKEDVIQLFSFLIFSIVEKVV